MATYTYDPAAAGSGRDFVRLSIGDRGTAGASTTITDAILANEEIDAIITLEANMWLAAAHCGEIILAQYLGMVSKAVEDLHLQVDHSKDSAYRAHIAKLRERGARELLRGTGAHSLRTMGTIRGSRPPGWSCN